MDSHTEIRRDGSALIWDCILPVWAFLFIVAVYAPLAGQRSAWSDDLPLLVDKSGIVGQSVDDGRPVLALVNWLVLGSTDTIGQLVLPRLLGVLGIALFVGYMTRVFRNSGWSSWTSALLACSVGLLPPFYGYAGWATAFSYPWLVLMGAWSGSTWVDSLRERRLARMALAFIVFLTAILAYPPAALFCWAVLGIRLASAHVSLRRSVIDSLSMGGLVLVAGTVGLAIGRIFMAVLDVEPSRLQIVDSVPEVVDKLVWFATHPIAVAARPFQISSPGNTAAVLTAGPVLVVIAVGLYLRQNGSRTERAASVSLLMGLCALTMTMHLVSVDNQIEYRFMPGIVVLTWVYLVVAIRAIHRWLSGRTAGIERLGVVGVAALAVVVGVATSQARTTIEQVFIRPAEVKEQYLTDRLEGFDPARHDRIVVLEPAEGWPSRTNLGIYSSRTDLGHGWVIEPNLCLLLEERHRDGVCPVVEVVDQPIELRSTDFGLDLRPLRSQL